MDGARIPGDGVVSGYGRIEGRLVFVYAYDFTVFGGTLSAENARKIMKVQDLALKNGAPVIALRSGRARVFRRGWRACPGMRVFFSAIPWLRG